MVNILISELFKPDVLNVSSNKEAYTIVCGIRNAIGHDCTKFFGTNGFSIKQNVALQDAIKASMSIDYVGTLQHLRNALTCGEDHNLTNSEFVVLDLVLSICELNCPSEYKEPVRRTIMYPKEFLIWLEVHCDRGNWETFEEAWEVLKDWYYSESDWAGILSADTQFAKYSAMMLSRRSPEWRERFESAANRAGYIPLVS